MGREQIGLFRFLGGEACFWSDLKLNSMINYVVVAANSGQYIKCSL